MESSLQKLSEGRKKETRRNLDEVTDFYHEDGLVVFISKHSRFENSASIGCSVGSLNPD